MTGILFVFKSFFADHKDLLRNTKVNIPLIFNNIPCWFNHLFDLVINSKTFGFNLQD